VTPVEQLRAENALLHSEIARLRDDRAEWRALAIWLIGLMCDDCRRWLTK